MSATWQIITGDCRDVLATLPAQSVHTVCTSPPYFGLRDYGTGEWEGGDPACGHVAGMARQDTERETPGGRGGSFRGGEVQFREMCGKCGARRVDRQIGLEPTPDEFVAALVAVFREVRRVLRDDGTVFLNLGDSYASTPPGNPGAMQARNGAGFRGVVHEERSGHRGIPAGYKAKDLLGIPWAVAFALRADGWVLRQEIIWAKPNPMPESVTDRCTKSHEQIFMFSKARWTGAEEPIPMREADAAWLAALVDGEGSICFQDRTSERAGQTTYSVRLSIVNTNRALLERVEQICGLAGVGSPSPRTRSNGESGRPVYVWQVTNAKAARVIAAIRPHLIAKATQADLALYVQALNRKHTGRGGYSVSSADQDAKGKAVSACSALNRGEDVDLAWFRPVKAGRWVPLPYAYDADAIREAPAPATLADARIPRSRPYEGDPRGGNQSHAQASPGHPVPTPESGRNKRSVWTVATQPYAGAHFATFPPKLIEPCILAGAPERACGECGAPWVRVVENHGPDKPNDHDRHTAPGQTIHHGLAAAKMGSTWRRDTLGFKPSCPHGDGSARGVVLDPFAGAGTTGMVALRHGRSFVGVELSPAYAEMARRRIVDDAPLLNQPGEVAA